MLAIMIAAAAAAAPLPDTASTPAMLAGVDISDATFNDQVYRLCGADMACQDRQRSARLRFLQVYPEAGDQQAMGAELAASILPSGIVNWARADQMLSLEQRREVAAMPDDPRGRGRRGIYCTSKVSKSGRKASVSCF